jgi:hypothetical protein
LDRFKITEEQKIRFAGIYLLEYMINTPQAIPIFLDGNNSDLEKILEWLLARGFIQIKDNEKYIPTPDGRKLLEKFMSRYSEYLTMFDIFGTVDLELGEFAFERYPDFETKEAWKKFLDDPRWDDVRIAVADYKKMDPGEIVYMSFINEKRFGRDESGWQFDLLLGSVWDEILHICNSSIQWQNLGYEDDEGEVSGESVIADIIEQGTNIILDLLTKEAGSSLLTFNTASNGEPDDESFVDRVDMPEFDKQHFEAYRDPNYKSPTWRN